MNRCFDRTAGTGVCDLDTRLTLPVSRSRRAAPADPRTWRRAPPRPAGACGVARLRRGRQTFFGANPGKGAKCPAAQNRKTRGSSPARQGITRRTRLLARYLLPTADGGFRAVIGARCAGQALLLAGSDDQHGAARCRDFPDLYLDAAGGAGDRPPGATARFVIIMACHP